MEKFSKYFAEFLNDYVGENKKYRHINELEKKSGIPRNRVYDIANAKVAKPPITVLKTVARACGKEENFLLIKWMEVEHGIKQESEKHKGVPIYPEGKFVRRYSTEKVHDAIKPSGFFSWAADEAREPVWIKLEKDHKGVMWPHSKGSGVLVDLDRDISSVAHSNVVAIEGEKLIFGILHTTDIGIGFQPYDDNLEGKLWKKLPENSNIYPIVATVETL